jgi:hypothetical protein
MLGKHPPHAIHYFEWIRENWNNFGLSEPSSREIVFLVEGYDAATGFSLLQDFLPWLVVRLGGGDNYTATGLLHAYASGAVLGENGFEYPQGNDRMQDGDVAKRVSDVVVEFLSGMFGEPKRQLFRDYDEYEVLWRSEVANEDAD